MLFKKIQKLIKRHPFLYLTRFRLLSKNANVNDIKSLNYNNVNSKSEIPNCFKEINNKIFKDFNGDNDFEKVMHLSIWLKEHIKGGPGLSEPSCKSLHTMLDGKGGVCSDIAQIFNNFCVLNDILVREWGTTSIPFNKLYGGHSFNEFYSKELKKWILIDVYWGFMFYDTNEAPLSVIEFFKLKRDGKEYYHKSFIKEPVEPSTVFKNYLDGRISPFLICNYKNKIYDAFLTNLRPYLPIFMIHFILYAIGRSYHYRFPMDDYKAIFS